jgi:ubiquinone/menaquinone biosynthesis C-methylase UbiE
VQLRIVDPTSVSNSAVPLEIRGPRERLCLAMSKLFLSGSLKRFGFRRSQITRFDTQANYIADRVEQVDEYVHLFRPFVSFAGNTVCELGCNVGYLLDGFLQRENFRAIGLDIDADALEIARETYGSRIEFVGTTATAIPLPDDSVDVMYTIDTVEHLSHPRQILAECFRVLRPGGTLLVHFHAWLGPYGSHLEDIIPFPWPNVVFSMDTLLKVAAHLYESPDYKPACYFLDPGTGRRKPNPYLDHARWNEYLNHIKIGEFRRMIRELPFDVIHLENIGFGGKCFPLARRLSRLAQWPIAEEFFTKATFTVLRKRNLGAWACSSEGLAMMLA